jgi:cell wall-associated NlpC family hydrolase
MSPLSKYQSAPYKDGARGPLAYDCYGLVIAVRHEVFGLPLLPSLGGVGRSKLRENTLAYRELKAGMDECAPEPGAIAAVFAGDLMAHVGIVIYLDGQLKVLDTNPGGPRIRPVRDFESAYQRVAYYK